MVWEYIAKYAGAYFLYKFRYKRILKKVLADQNPESYTDIAMTPVEEGEEENLEMFTVTVSAQEFVKKRRKLDEKHKEQ